MRRVLQGGDAAVARGYSFKLPGSLATGTYSVSVQITDPAGVSPPLQLASTGRQADGSYTLGTVVIQ